MSSAGTILVVEDEPLIRMTAVEAFEDAGFVVFEAGSADEALRLLSCNTDIDAVFTDVDMPGKMNGIELSIAVRTLNPAIAIVVTSGFLKVPRSMLPSNVPFFSKPYQMDKVISSIHAPLLPA